MAELVTIIIDLLSIPFQIVGEILAGIIAWVFRAVFSKPKLDENGDPVSDHDRPSNRWEILGFSLLGTLALSLIFGGVCWLYFQSFFAAQCGTAISAFLGMVGALKAAID